MMNMNMSNERTTVQLAKRMLMVAELVATEGMPKFAINENTDADLSIIVDEMVIDMNLEASAGNINFYVTKVLIDHPVLGNSRREFEIDYEFCGR